MLEYLKVYESPEFLDLGSLDAFAHTCSSGEGSGPSSNSCKSGNTNK